MAGGQIKIGGAVASASAGTIREDSTFKSKGGREAAFLSSLRLAI